MLLRYLSNEIFDLTGNEKLRAVDSENVRKMRVIVEDVPSKEVPLLGEGFHWAFKPEKKGSTNKT